MLLGLHSYYRSRVESTLIDVTDMTGKVRDDESSEQIGHCRKSAWKSTIDSESWSLRLSL